VEVGRHCTAPECQRSHSILYLEWDPRAVTSKNSRINLKKCDMWGGNKIMAPVKHADMYDASGINDLVALIFQCVNAHIKIIDPNSRAF